MIQIRNCKTKGVLYECADATTIRDAVLAAVGSGADLRGAKLYGASLRAADLSDANLRAADLSRADLSGSDLSGADLRAADLCRANLSSVDLSGADLRAADLSGASLEYAILSDADLRDTDLRGAILRAADLSDANLNCAKIGSGDVAAHLGSGDGALYPWRAWLMKDNSIVLCIGCEEHPLEWWRSSEGMTLCTKEGGSKAQLEALCIWVEALVGREHDNG